MMFDLFFLFQITAFILCLVVYRKLSFPYKLFAPFLFFITLYETLSFTGLLRVNNSAIWSFNIFTSIEFAFYGLLLLSLTMNRIQKKILFYSLIVTLVFTMVYIVFLNRFNEFNTSTFVLQSFIIITACCMYYYFKIQNARTEILILNEPAFWLYTGLLFYYLGGFLFFASYSQMNFKQNPNYLLLYRIVTNVSNIILYSCLIKLFLCFRLAKT